MPSVLIFLWCKNGAGLIWLQAPPKSTPSQYALQLAWVGHQDNIIIIGHISATQAYSLVPNLCTCLDCTSPSQPIVWWISWGSVFQTCTHPWSENHPWCSGLGSWTHSGWSWTLWWHTRGEQSCGNLQDWKVKSYKMDKINNQACPGKPRERYNIMIIYTDLFTRSLWCMFLC